MVSFYQVAVLAVFLGAAKGESFDEDAAYLAYPSHMLQPIFPYQIQSSVPRVPIPVDEEVSSPADYSYAYDVQDQLTGDSKTHAETRQGDVVRGSYSLIEPDGTRRTVEYTADPVNGFNAVVHREPPTGGFVTYPGTPVSNAPNPVAPVAAAPISFHHLMGPFARLAVPLSASVQDSIVLTPVTIAASSFPRYAPSYPTSIKSIPTNSTLPVTTQ